MARVSVNDSVHADLRLTLASRMLRLNRERLVYRLLIVWSRVTESNSSILRTRMLATALGRDAELVVDALVATELAGVACDESLDLAPMRSLFGDYEWYADKLATSQSGGKVRADHAERDAAGRFVARDLRQEVIETLVGRPHRRSELVTVLRARKASLYQCVRQLIDEGDIIELDDGRLTLATDTGVPMDAGSAEPGIPPDGHPGNPPGNPARSSAPAPAPASAQSPATSPAHESECQSEHAVSPTVDRGTSSAVDAGTSQGYRSRSRSTGNERYSALFELWDRIGRKHCGKSWRSPGELAGQYRIQQALEHPELVGRSNDDIRHGLAMLRAECAERARLGQTDAWSWYRNAWHPRVLSAACEIPDESAARERADRESRKSAMSWLDEVNAEIRAEERANACA